MTKNPIAAPILTITNNLSLGQEIQDLLTEAKLPVVLKESAYKAIQYLKAEPRPQMIIVDWLLPDNLAPRFMQELRGAKRFADLSILVIVDEPDPQAIKTALQAGANRYLTQGFIQTNLIRTLRDMRVKIS